MLIYKQQDHGNVTRKKEMNSKVFELSKFVSELDDQGGYFIDFISTKGIQAGIIRLHPGEIIPKDRIQSMRSIMLLKPMALSD